ncbi:Lymphoid-specific helicase, partial [Atta colombica]
TVKEETGISFIVIHNDVVLGESTPLIIDPGFKEPPQVYDVNFEVEFLFIVNDHNNIGSIVSTPILIKVTSDVQDQHVPDSDRSVTECKQKITANVPQQMSTSSSVIDFCTLDLMPILLGEKLLVERLIVQTPLSENVKFEDGKWTKYRDLERTKRWRSLSKLQSRARLSKYKLDYDYAHIKNMLDVELDLRKVCQDEPRIEWNFMNRSTLWDVGSEIMKKHLVKYIFIKISFVVLHSIRSMNRLILTGTPLQNNLSELWSLLNFLLPEIFDDLDTFESWFDVKELQYQHGTEKLLKQEEEKHVLSSLREILKPFMLRRVKSEVCLEIPPKKELIVYAPLTELQYDLYKAVLNYDLEMLSKIEVPDLIIQTVNGERPKRQCFLRSPYGSIKGKSKNRELNISVNNNIKQKPTKSEDKLSKCKQYTDVTERNREFLVRINFQNRMPMYKKIVNHPYLVHCPLNSTGLPKIDNDLIRSSGKLLVLDAMLAKLKMRGHKVLLFSTMTMILDMIEDYLTLRDYNYVRLDGTTKIEVRKQNIATFNNDPDMFLFLISIRAGGIGLNLMSADTVIVYDSDWNPQVDIQAMARCHRIGQTKPVVIYKLCTKGTIDEAIMKRADAKRILEKMVMSKELQSLNINRVLEMKKLMESKEYKIVTSEKEVFTEMELNNLLDRSDMIIKNDIMI